MHLSNVCFFEPRFIDQVMEIENDSFSIPWVSSGFIEELGIPGSFIFLAIDDSGCVQGFIVFRMLLDEIHLLKIAVRRKDRRFGIAMSLMSKMFEIARLKKAHVIYLEVSAINSSAISLYKKYGFIETGIRYKYYGEEDALNMECILDSMHSC